MIVYPTHTLQTALVNMMESARLGSLNSRSATESAQQALKHASVHISVKRCCKASSCLNKELTPVVADETTFEDATPHLFSDSFQQK